MKAIFLTLLVSFVLAALAVSLFVWAVRRGEPDHADRLALMPLDDDAEPRTPASDSESSVVSSKDPKEAKVPCDR